MYSAFRKGNRTHHKHSSLVYPSSAHHEEVAVVYPSSAPHEEATVLHCTVAGQIQCMHRDGQQGACTATHPIIESKTVSDLPSTKIPCDVTATGCPTMER